MEPPNDKWLRWVGIPVVVLVANLFYLEDYHYNPKRYFGWSLFGMVYVAVVWEVVMRWLLYVRRQYAGIAQTRRRVFVTLAGYLLITAVHSLAFLYVIDILNTAFIPVSRGVYITGLLTGFVCTLFMGNVYEVRYYLQTYREAIQESEAVQKAGLQSQFDNLKNQVNPHFLFNALNSLSALISEDRQKAGLFLDELSSVYRYLLQAAQQPLVTLADEMAFLTAYRYLLDTRFGKALHWEVGVDDRYMDQWIPPLTLQTLVENALRHNLLLTEQPLTLHIAIREGKLIVCNSIQRKKTPVLAQQGGLTTLAARLSALGLARPLIEDDGQQFKVCLTLVRKEQLVFPSLVNKASAG
ncbi:histidine kinase [Spirosoma taeanense]|uniref:Histidine kinase n=1 Tax=Spirosoma taeanense TaxID=2735870 RepID=A0A6M5Y3K2_9BACT|nr:histidine kinase [Spirosoma taeanense]QJW88315.1 histidine kinase [Spirosoma taeanense]